MIDCHTHLNHAAFDADRAEVVAQAKAVGVRYIAVVGEDEKENEAVAALSATEPMLLPFFGLHPDRFAHEAPSAEAIAAIYARIGEEAEALTGIGEVGLDYWVCKEEPLRKAQRQAFEGMIELSLVYDLHLNVHSRSAGHYTLDMLMACGAKRVLMHAFDGRASHARRGAEAGYYFSVPPSIVRSEQKQKMVKALPLERLVLETDSPVLGPQPRERNQPANVLISATAIAEAKAIDLEAVQSQTTQNAMALFGLSFET